MNILVGLRALFGNVVRVKRSGNEAVSSSAVSVDRLATSRAHKNTRSWLHIWPK